MTKQWAVFLAWLMLATPVAPAQQPTAPAQQPAAPKISAGSLNLSNASLTEVIDTLCRALKLNYIIDPAVKGSVSIQTYGETRDIDARNLLDLVLRINGATIVPVGDIHRIVPVANAARLPLPPVTDPSKIAQDDQVMLFLVFLKYASVAEVSKLVGPFIGEGAQLTAYPPANLLFLLDSRRNIKRSMEIIGLFDSDTLARQRVRLFEVKNGSPSSIAKELEEVLKTISLTDKTLVRLMPIDRINTIIAIAPNPGAFEEIEKWIQKFDTEVKITAGSIDNYVYRVKYGRAEILAMAIMSLYMGGYGMMGMMGMGMGMGMGGFGMGGYGGGAGGYTGGGYGMGGYPGMSGGYGMGGYGMMGGYPGGGMMGGYPGMMGGFSGGYGLPMMGGYAPQYPMGQPRAGTAAGTGTGAGTDQTGTYLGAQAYNPFANIPRLMPNPMDNTLLIQATPQEYQQILKLLKEIDIPPRQVLIDARVFEVSLTGAFASGVSAYLQKRGTGTGGASTIGRDLLAQTAGGTTSLSVGALVGMSRELLAFLSLSENATRAKVISAPSIIATDSIGASINVGVEVPTLTAQAVSPIQSGGNSLFANTIQNRSTGVTLSITARINPSGIVTLVINQDVSAPQAPQAGSIQSPSFSKRSIQTQVTVQDGDTIAIGGIINETDGYSTAGIPVLHKIPVIGAMFGSRSYSKERTELIVFMTPRVIYDTNQIVEASDELKSRLRKLSKMVKESDVN